MANTTIITTAEYKNLVNPSMTADRDTELQAAINAAAAWFRRVADWELEQTAYTLNLDGNDAIGPSHNVLLAPAKYRPVDHAGTPVTVTEDGTALTVATGYDASADVILVGVDRNERMELVKPNANWSRGYQNVAVTLTAGYASGSIPAEVKQVVIEVSRLFFNMPQMAGKQSKSSRAGARSFEKELSPQSQLYLQAVLEHVA